MTIYDIASLAGVSASTVSRVINNKPGISSKTRKKIEKLLKQYSYTPNEVARGLAINETRLIGILIPDIRYAHYSDMAYFMERELSSHGYTSLIINTGLKEEDKVNGLRAIATRHVDGLLLVGSTFQCEMVKEFISQELKDIPVVMANGYLDFPNVRGVLVDEYKGVKDLIKKMEDRGHGKIAFIIPNDTPSNLRKKEGFIDSMKASENPNCADWIFEAETSFHGGSEVCAEILSKHPEANGLIFSEDLSAVSAVRALSKLGKKVPRDISVAGIDNTRYCEICMPRLTSLDNKMLEMGMEAARIILECLEGKTPPEKIMLFCNVIERESL